MHEENSKNSKLSNSDGLLEFIGNGASSSFLPERYFIKKFNSLFYKYSFNAQFANPSVAKVKDALELAFKLTNESYIFKSEYENKDKAGIDMQESSFILEIKEGILLLIEDGLYTIFYDVKINFSIVEEILNVIKRVENGNPANMEFSMVATLSNGTFYLKNFDVKKQKINLKSNYNDDFKSVDKIITNFLKSDNETGLILLHGKYGTGKTHYIRNLIANTDRQFILFPNELIDSISSPGFLPFISDQANSVIVLEDSDDLLKQRLSTNHKNEGVVNLLNMSDGLLGDALAIKIICTFNTNLKNIDQAILRKGRLVAKYEFKELSVLKAQSLSNKLGFKTIISSPMTLADIYNQDKENFSDSSHENIGFKTT